MVKVITTNKARKILAREFKVENFNIIALADVQKYFKKIGSNGEESYWEPKGLIQWEKT